MRESNRRGHVSVARGGPHTRTLHLFVDVRDNARLDALSGFGFPPIAEAVWGWTL